MGSFFGCLVTTAKKVLWAHQTLFLNDKNKQKISQTSQNSNDGNLLDILSFSSYEIFFEDAFITQKILRLLITREKIMWFYTRVLECTRIEMRFESRVFKFSA